MKHLLSSYGLCTTECECALNGIPCMGNVCLCIHNTSAHECCNPSGKHVYNADVVNAFRNELLCKEVK